MKTPTYFPALSLQAIRWLRGDRIDKGKAEDLATIRRPLSYPFVLLRADPSAESLLICGENSCFASTDESDRVDDLILASL